MVGTQILLKIRQDIDIVHRIALLPQQTLLPVDDLLQFTALWTDLYFVHLIIKLFAVKQALVPTLKILSQ